MQMNTQKITIQTKKLKKQIVNLIFKANKKIVWIIQHCMLLNINEIKNYVVYE